MAPVFTLFVIIFLEGYVVLSTELLAIRLLLPFTGSGTDTVSIIIAAVLMPLAFGYFAGGRFKVKHRTGRTAFTVRKKLIQNLVIAALILTPGLSYIFLNDAYTFVRQNMEWSNRIWITTVYALVFLVYPVFLLGQTVPLVGNYFSRQRLPQIAGRILFFSTMGSFMGAVFGTLVLMTFLGVHHTVTITIGCMAFLVFILSKKKMSPAFLCMLILLAAAATFNSETAMKQLNIVKNNKYNTIQIEEKDDTRLLKLNRTAASAVYIDSEEPRFSYSKFIENNIIEQIREKGAVRNILILGAGGFTLGRTDLKNRYTYVDIDKDLKDVSEKLFLKEPIAPNKTFKAVEARAFLNQTEEEFDLIVIDLFRDPTSDPEYLITREFFEQLKAHLNDGGVIVWNYIASASFADPFSAHLDNTLRAVFPNINRIPLRTHDLWENRGRWSNVIYTYIHNPNQAGGIYTDDKNTAVFDKPAHLPR